MEVVGSVKSLDLKFNEFVDRNQHPVAIQTLEALTSLGSFHFAGVLILFLWSFGETALLKQLSIGLVASSIVIYTGKHLVKRKRPKTGVDHIVKRASFPSGHSGVAFVTATVLHSQINRGVTLFGLAASVAFSRVYLEDHYLSDVIVGSLTGLGVGLLIVGI